MSEHSRLFPPSGAYRWVNCSASAAAVAQYPDPPDESAMEGTAWHWLVEQCLVRKDFFFLRQPEDILGRTIVVREENVERSFVVTREMATDARLAVDFVRAVAQTPGTGRVEARIDLSWIEPGFFGRCDVWHLGVDRVLTVADGKYGRVDVDVAYPDGTLNWQMVVYALGVVEELSQTLRPEQMPHHVRLVVIQPRSIMPVPRVKQVVVPAEQLLALETPLRQAVERVKNIPTFTAGPWCKYCPALGACPATQDDAQSLAPLLQRTELTATDAARILSKKDLLDKIVKEAERVALDSLLRGIDVPGFKIVTGRKHRTWRDEDLAAQRAAEVLGAFKVVTPAQMEKLPGGREVVAELAHTPPGDPTVAPTSDKRLPYVARSAAEMFGASVAALGGP